MDAAEHTAPDEHATEADAVVATADNEATSDATPDAPSQMLAQNDAPASTAHPTEIEHVLTSAHTLLTDTMQNISSMLGNLGHMISSLRPASTATDESAAETPI